MIVIYIENFRVFSDFRCLKKFVIRVQKERFLEFFVFLDVFGIKKSAFIRVIEL